MFAMIFTFTLVIAYAAAEIPSYIHICGRRDPEIEQCILNNINNLKIKICKGIPELDIPSNDPFIIKKLVLAETPEIKLYIINAQIRGFCEFNITHFRADIDTLHYDVELIFDQIRAKTTYDFDIRLLVPIVHKGPLYITTDNIGAKVSLDFKIVTRNGKRYTYLAKMKLNLDIKKYNAEYNVEGDQFGQLQKIIHNFIGQNQEEIIKSLKPALEEQISKRIISIANGVVKHFTYEELFPEQIA
ncbi:protein takeout-like [Temnothorax longispinosus]|uniref:protein takeout-like n=1 Tax=Temnothorax longispinosus TaxID=300112 RepID=UPI003A9A64E4